MNTFYQALILIVLGFIPSLIWLIYYLKKDCQPEPKSLIAKTVFVGMLIAPLAVIAQLIFVRIYTNINPGFQSSTSLAFLLWAAFVEEYVKYLAVKVTILRNPQFDEPTDAMIYLISASLGFAAVENILVLFQAIPNGLTAAIQIWLLRFAGATLLHAVSSALLGYFLGLSWFYWQHNRKIMAFGFIAATFSHYVFNISLLTANSQSTGFLYSSFALMILVVLISILFGRLRRRMAC